MSRPLSSPDRALPGLTGNQLKAIAAVCMLVDHTTKILLIPLTLWLTGGRWPEEMQALCHQLLYPVGAVSFPLFCFLFAEGYTHTRNKKKYLLRLTVFALISELPFDLAFFSPLAKDAGTFPFYWDYQNVLFTFLLGFVTLSAIDCVRPHHRILRRLAHAGIAIASWFFAQYVLRADYQGYGLALIVVLYLLRGSRNRQLLGMLAVTLLAKPGRYPLSFLAALFLIWLYNGQRGEKNTGYFFYIFYPAHLLVLHLLELAVAALC